MLRHARLSALRAPLARSQGAAAQPPAAWRPPRAHRRSWSAKAKTCPARCAREKRRTPGTAGASMRAGRSTAAALKQAVTPAGEACASSSVASLLPVMLGSALRASRLSCPLAPRRNPAVAPSGAHPSRISAKAPAAPGVRLESKTGAAERAEGGRQLRRPPRN